MRVSDVTATPYPIVEIGVTKWIYEGGVRGMGLWRFLSPSALIHSPAARPVVLVAG